MNTPYYLQQKGTQDPATVPNESAALYPSTGRPPLSKGTLQETVTDTNVEALENQETSF